MTIPTTPATDKASLAETAYTLPSFARTNSRSVSGGRAGNGDRGSFSSLKDRVARALSPGRDVLNGGRRPSFGASMSTSEERGRQPIISTGRGGAGNLVRSPSRGVDPDVPPGIERGRELYPHELAHSDRVTHAGRGGAGNIRSPSRDPKKDAAVEKAEEALQDKLIAERRGRQADAPFSSGRGGAGNISTSRSRSRSKARDQSEKRDGSRTRHTDLLHPVQSAHSAGRGGYGNIIEEKHSQEDLQRLAQEQRYEAEIRKRHEEEEAQHPHPIGRGGAGSVGQTYTHVDLSTLTLEEREAYAKVHANDSKIGQNMGRGGAGNIITPSHSSNNSPDGRGRGRAHENGEKHSGGVFGSMLRSLSRAAGGGSRDHSREPSKEHSKEASKERKVESEAPLS